MVRRVVARVGEVLESLPEPAIQKALRLPKGGPAKLLTIGVDGSMLSTREGWHETKLGVVVRDEHHLVGEPGHRGMVSEARYVAGAEVQEFGPRLLAAAEAAGLATAERVVVVSDGAHWIRNLTNELFPQAIQVLDWPHLVQHVHACGKALLGEDAGLLAMWMETCTTLVWNGKADVVCQDLRTLLTMDDVDKTPVEELLRYSESNLSRVNYPYFREHGLPVGSGIVESAHKRTCSPCRS